MNTKSNQDIKRTFILLAFVVLAAAMSGCVINSGNNNAAATPNVNTSNVNSSTPQNTQAQQTPTPNPVEAFYGEWETKDPSSGQFERWRLGTADKEGSEYVGRITNLSTNANLGKYKVGISDKSITLELAGAQSGSFTYEYEVSPDRNTITLKGSNPIVLKRGTANADMLKDVETFYNGVWKLDDAAAKSLNYTPPVEIVFERSNKYDEGYSGDVRLFEISTGSIAELKYIIPSKNKIKISDRNGSKSATYEIMNNGNILKIDYEDPGSADLFLTKK